MSRDIRFEIEYLLSITIASLGFLSSDLSTFMDNRIAYIFLCFISLHLLVFNSYYVFSRIMDIQLSRMPELTTISRYSFYLTSVSFSYLLSHIVTTGFYKTVSVCPNEQATNTLFSGYRLCSSADFWSISFHPAKMLIMYASPIVGVLVFMAPLLAVVPSIQFFDDIEVVVSPTDLEITDNFDDTITLSISLMNNSQDERDFDVLIDLPEDITLRHDGTTHEDTFKKPVTLTGQRPADKLNIELKYTGTTRNQTQIPIQIQHRFTSKTQTVDVDLYP